MDPLVESKGVLRELCGQFDGLAEVNAWFEGSRVSRVRHRTEPFPLQDGQCNVQLCLRGMPFGVVYEE